MVGEIAKFNRIIIKGIRFIYKFDSAVLMQNVFDKPVDSSMELDRIGNDGHYEQGNGGL